MLSSELVATALQCAMPKGNGDSRLSRPVDQDGTTLLLQHSHPCEEKFPPVSRNAGLCLVVCLHVLDDRKPRAGLGLEERHAAFVRV